MKIVQLFLLMGVVLSTSVNVYSSNIIEDEYRGAREALKTKMEQCRKESGANGETSLGSPKGSHYRKCLEFGYHYDPKEESGLTFNPFPRSSDIQAKAAILAIKGSNIATTVQELNQQIKNKSK